MAYIYALSDPNNPVIPKYIGRTRKDPRQRLYEHMVWAFGPRCKNPQMQEWLRKLSGQGKVPVLLVYEVAEDSAISQREHYWTEFFKPLGLYNIKSGDAQPTGDTIHARRQAWLKTKRGQHWLAVTRPDKQKQPSLLLWGHRQYFKRLRTQGAMKRAKAVICVETGQRFASAGQAASTIGKSSNSVKGSCKEGWKAGGFHWKYDTSD